MNIRDEEPTFQVDTGPVAFPDLSRRYERLPDALSLAFVAFNAPHFADFVIEDETPILQDEPGIDPGPPLFADFESAGREPNLCH